MRPAATSCWPSAPAPTHSKSQSKGKGGGRSNTVLVLIAIFKLVKVVLLVTLGLGLLRLVGGDAGETLTRFVRDVKMDPHNQFIHGAIEKVSGLSGAKLHALSIGTFVYAAIFLVEGIGLLLKKHWAEWLTVIVTASFIPLEVYELVDGASPVKVGGIALNVAIVAYLVVRLIHEHRERKGKKGDKHDDAQHEDDASQDRNVAVRV